MAFYSTISTVMSVLVALALAGLLVYVLIQMRPSKARTLAAAGLGCLLIYRVWSFASGFVSGAFIPYRDNYAFPIFVSITTNLLFLAGVALLAYAAVQALTGRAPAVNQNPQPFAQQPAQNYQVPQGFGQGQQYGQPVYQQPQVQQPAAPQQPYPGQQGFGQGGYAQPNNPYGPPRG